MDIYSIGLRVDSRQVKQAQADMGRFGQQSQKTGAAVGKFNAKTKAAAASTSAMGTASKFATRAVAGIGAALSVRALQRYTASAINAADQIGKMAQTAGVSAERIQELRFAFGQLAGTTDTEVDSSIRRFNRRLGLAADGTGAAKDTFGELGIAIEDTGGNLRGTEAVLEDTLRQLAQVEDESRRAAKASEIFGEDAGPKLAGALSEGEDAVREMSARAHELGLVLGGDAVQNAEELSDQLDILNKTMMVNFQKGLMSSLAGDSESFSQAIADPQFQQGLQTLGDFIGDSLSFLVENADTIVRVGRSLALIGLSAKLGGAVGGRRGAVGGAAVGGVLAALSEIVASGETELQGQQDGGPRRIEITGGTERAPFPVSDELLEQQRQQEKLMKLVQESGTVGEKAFNKWQFALKDVADTVQNDISEGLTDIIMQAESASDVFANLARQIARTLVQQQIADPLAQGITDFAIGAAGNLFGGGAGSASIGGGASPNVRGIGPARANGGNVFGQTAHMVGERGPELFVPRQDGQIVPNHQMGGGGDVTVNIINQSGEQLQSEQQNKRRGPNGEMTVDVMVKSSMERLDSQGQLDGIFRRHGARRQGQF